jgi:hypothetical protein
VILDRFGDYIFPVFNIGDSVGAQSRADIYPTPGGGFDPNKSDDAADRSGTITRRCEIIHQISSTEYQALLDAARAQRGKRRKLFARTASDDPEDAEVRWLWARCASVGVERGSRNWRFQPIVMVFNCANYHWNGRAHATWELDDGTDLDSGFYFDEGSETGNLVSSPDSFTLNNGGNKTVTNVIMAITAGSANITSITIRIGDAELVWTGTLAAGDVLLIDAGSYRVLNDSGDAYAGLAFGANHTIDDWIRLEPGDNTMTVTWAGGGTGSAWTMNYWDGWY